MAIKKTNRVFLAGTIAVGMAVALATSASAATWTASHTHYGGGAYVDQTDDCQYTYDGIIPGASSATPGYGWSVNNGGCEKVRVRVYFKDTNWAGWSSWSTGVWLSESVHRPYTMWTNHQVYN